MRWVPGKRPRRRHSEGSWRSGPRPVTGPSSGVAEEKKAHDCARDEHDEGHDRQPEHEPDEPSAPASVPVALLTPSGSHAGTYGGSR